MSKETEKIEIEDGAVNVLLGRLLTVVDASLQDKEQRKAVRSIMISTVWDWYENYDPDKKQATLMWSAKVPE